VHYYNKSPWQHYNEFKTVNLMLLQRNIILTHIFEEQKTASERRTTIAAFACVGGRDCSFSISIFAIHANWNIDGSYGHPCYCTNCRKKYKHPYTSHAPLDPSTSARKTFIVVNYVYYRYYVRIHEVCCGHRFTHDTLRLTVHEVCVRFFPLLCVSYTLRSQYERA